MLYEVYKNFFKNDYDGINISSLFKSDKDAFFKYIFTFYSPQNVENNFSRLDELLYLKYFKINSLILYKTLDKELRKRRVYIKEKDFIELFTKNLLYLYEYIKISHILSKNSKVYLSNTYNKDNFLLQNTFKPLLIRENVEPFSVSNFQDKGINDKFYIIFDKLVNINDKKYKEYILQKRSEYTTIHLPNYDVFKQKDIKSYVSNKKFRNYKAFHIKGKKNIDCVNIYVGDISKDEFTELFNILSILFNGKRYNIYMKKAFDEFKKVSKKNINIFLKSKNELIKELWWTNETRYILSTSNLKEDLILLFQNNLNKKLNVLKTKEFKDFSEKERISFYNTFHYTNNRVNAFIDYLKED